MTCLVALAVCPLACGHGEDGDVAFRGGFSSSGPLSASGPFSEGGSPSEGGSLSEGGSFSGSGPGGGDTTTGADASTGATTLPITTFGDDGGDDAGDDGGTGGHEGGGGGGVPQCEPGVAASQTTIQPARPGFAERWEGGLLYDLHPRAYQIHDVDAVAGTADVVAINPTTGGVVIRWHLAAWRDRLPDRIALVHDGQASDPTRRVRLDWDRRATSGEDTVTVEDRDLRPVAFTRVGSELVPPLGVHAALTETAQGYDFVRFDAPDRVEHFAAIGSGALALVAVTDPYGNTIAVTHHPDGRIAAIVPARAGAITASYDGDGRLTGIAGPAGTATLTWSDGQLVAIAPGTEDGGFTIAYEDELAPDQPSLVVTPTGRTVDLTYNADATVHCVGVPGNTHTFEYVSATEIASVDRFGQASRRRYEDGALTRLDAPMGATINEWVDRDLVRTTDWTGRIHEQTWDDHGHPLTWIDDNGVLTEYTWSGDRLASQTTLGATTTYQRNAQGRITAKIAAGGGSGHTTTYAWSSVGLVTSMTDLGQTHAYSYDADDRIVQLEQGGVVTFTVGYDAKGRVQTATTGANETFTYAYTGDHLLPSTVTLPSGATMELSSGSQVYVHELELRRAGGLDPNVLQLSLTDDGRPAALRHNGALLRGFSY